MLVIRKLYRDLMIWLSLPFCLSLWLYRRLRITTLAISWLVASLLVYPTRIMQHLRLHPGPSFCQFGLLHVCLPALELAGSAAVSWSSCSSGQLLRYKICRCNFQYFSNDQRGYFFRRRGFQYREVHFDPEIQIGEELIKRTSNTICIVWMLFKGDMSHEWKPEKGVRELYSSPQGFSKNEYFRTTYEDTILLS